MQKIINWFLLVMSFIGIGIICVFVEVNYLSTPPETTQTIYANKIVMPNGEKKSFIEVLNYEKREGSVGYRVVELRINSYTDPDLRYAMGYGLQWVDYNNNGKFGVRNTNTNTSGAEETAASWDIEPNEITYYQTNTFTSFEAISQTDFAENVNEFYFTTGKDEDVFMARLDGYKTENWRAFDEGKTIRTAISCFFWPVAIGNAVVYREDAFGVSSYYTQRVKYAVEDLMLEAINLTHSSNGYGESDVEAVMLSKYFLLKHSVDKQFVELEQSDNNKNNAFFTASVYRNARGVVSAKQSLFKMISGDAGYSINGVGGDNEFYEVCAGYTLNNNDFDTIYSASLGGNLLYLKQEKYGLLLNLPNANVDVRVDLDDTDIVGFGSYCFFDLEIKSLSLHSDTPKAFTLSAYSLTNSHLPNIITDGTIYIQNSPNSGYTEVNE